MEDLPWRLAIDFGTSNTSATVAQANGGIRVLRLGASSDAVPSCVAVYNDEIITGESALQVAGIHPAAFEPTPKRRLSEDAVVLGGKVFDPVDLVAAVLRFVVGQAVRFAGGSLPSEVVLTHPEAWDEYMKHRLIESAVRAGIPDERLVLIPEPVAAAWHYAAAPGTQPGTYIAVLDFGGGTCDAAVLQMASTPQGPSYQVVSSDGIDPLGGHDFDAVLENWVYAQLTAEGKTKLLQGLRSEHGAADRAVLRDQVREAKHSLSFHNSAPIGVRSGKHEWVCTVTRSEFEQLIAPQVNRAVELVHRVIQNALPSVEQLHRVYLTGGSSYIPALQSKLGEILPMKLGLMGDPKQVTSVGALQTPRSSIYLYNSERLQPRDNQDPVPKSKNGEHQQGHRTAQQPNKLRKLLLIGGIGLAAVFLLTGIAVAVSMWSGSDPAATTGTPGPDPSSTTGSAAPGAAGSSATATEPARLCGGVEKPSLSADECALLNNTLSAGLIAPASCRTHDGSLGSATSSITCQAGPGSDLTDAQKPLVRLYGYDDLDALDTAFDGYIETYGATNGDVTQPPSWHAWTSNGAEEGRILGLVRDGVNYLVWTEEDSLLEIWAVSEEVSMEQLYEWWTEESS